MRITESNLTHQTTRIEFLRGTQEVRQVQNLDAGESDESDLEHLIGYNLKRAYLVVQSDFRNALGEDGFSTRVFAALSLAVTFPQITQTALAAKMGIERSGLVAIVDELERKGLLTRMAVPTDRRTQALVPTPRGREAYAIALQKVRAHEDLLFSTLTPDEKATLLSLLQKIRQGER